MGISLVGDIFGLVDSGGSCISTVAMVRPCEAIQARLVATLSIVRELYRPHIFRASIRPKGTIQWQLEKSK